MYAPPTHINGKYVIAWARYQLRNHSGKFVIFWGHDSAGLRTQRQIDKQYGPCGLNPSKYIHIFRNVDEDSKDEEIKCKGEYAYVTVTDRDWDTLPGPHHDEVKTNDHQFQGRALKSRFPY